MGFSPVIVAPTYNNASTLLDVLSGLAFLKLPIIVVDDGCTDNTTEQLTLAQKALSELDLIIITHNQNCGKAVALRTGFSEAKGRGFTHAITVDTDGQHNPAGIPPLLNVAREAPSALVLGSRARQMSKTPGANLVGWWLSALGMRVETGRTVMDSQCGLRVYPLTLFDVVHCRAGRFGFEAEIITRALWAGVPVKEVPVECLYLPDDDRVSHFRPVFDGVYGFLMHAWLTILRLIPWPRKTYVADSKNDANDSHPDDGFSLARWINPLQLWHQLRHDRFQQLVVASAVGIGTFMSAMPVPGYQALLAVYSALRLRLHLLPLIAGSLLFLTPVGEFLFKISLGMGHVLTHLSLPDFSGAMGERDGQWAMLRQFPLSGFIGAVIVGFLSKWIATGLLFFVFRVIPVEHADTNTAPPRVY